MQNDCCYTLHHPLMFPLAMHKHNYCLDPRRQDGILLTLWFGCLIFLIFYFFCFWYALLDEKYYVSQLIVRGTLCSSPLKPKPVC